jgi:hypothetical protein
MKAWLIFSERTWSSSGLTAGSFSDILLGMCQIFWRARMLDIILLIFVLCDDLLKALNLKEDSQVQMNNAEVMTVALVAAYFFSGNHEAARKFLREHNYIPNMLSKSRFNRILHAIDETVWLVSDNVSSI